MCRNIQGIRKLVGQLKGLCSVENKLNLDSNF